MPGSSSAAGDGWLCLASGNQATAALPRALGALTRWLSASPASSEGAPQQTTRRKRAAMLGDIRNCRRYRLALGLTVPCPCARECVLMASLSPKLSLGLCRVGQTLGPPCCQAKASLLSGERVCCIAVCGELHTHGLELATFHASAVPQLLRSSCIFFLV